MATTNVTQYARARYVISLDTEGGRHYVSLSVYDGVRWQARVTGNRHGYKTLAGAQKVYNAKVEQIDEMLTQQGR